MAKFTVRKGRRYRATIRLTGLKRLASNDTIAGVLRNVGFTQVSVEGSGGTRYAEAVWSRPDATADIPQEVERVEELDGPLQAALTARGKRKPKTRATSRTKRKKAPAKSRAKPKQSAKRKARR
jgi:hypothetical protein